MTTSSRHTMPLNNKMCSTNKYARTKSNKSTCEQLLVYTDTNARDADAMSKICLKIPANRNASKRVFFAWGSEIFPCKVLPRKESYAHQQHVCSTLSALCTMVSFRLLTPVMVAPMKERDNLQTPSNLTVLLQMFSFCTEAMHWNYCVPSASRELAHCTDNPLNLPFLCILLLYLHPSLLTVRLCWQEAPRTPFLMTFSSCSRCGFAQADGGGTPHCGSTRNPISSLRLKSTGAMVVVTSMQRALSMVASLQEALQQCLCLTMITWVPASFAKTQMTMMNTLYWSSPLDDQ